jgi:hypothetical protein
MIDLLLDFAIYKLKKGGYPYPLCPQPELNKLNNLFVKSYLAPLREHPIEQMMN